MANSLTFPVRSYYVHVIFLLVMLAALNVVSFELTVIHTNDVRARFDPVSAKRGRDCTAEQDEQGPCYGGLARRVTKINEIRNSTENVLLLDAGHQFQGSIWFYVYRGLATAHFMNRLSYDAMAIGQHEFDFGVEGLASFLSNITFPALASNIDTVNEPSIDGLLPKQHIVTFANGERVGIVGYIYKETPDDVNTGDLTFREELEGLQPVVDSLISLGVNKIVALGHSGYDKALDIANNLEGVDVVVSGRDFTLLYTGEKPSTETPKGDYPTVIHPKHDPAATVLVVQAYAYGKYLGNLNVSFDDDGAVSGFGGNTFLLDDSVVEDAETLQEMGPWRDHVTEIANQMVGKTFVPLELAACASSECAIGNLVADAMLFPHFNGTDSWSDVSIALTTTGSIGSSIKVGDITRGTLNKVLPYGDSIDVVELRGDHLLEALEHSVFDLDEDATNYQMMQLSGIHVSYDLEREPGSRVISAFVRCADCKVPDYEQLKIDQIYKVAVNSYVGSGNYGYTSIKDKKISVVRGGLDVDVLKDYLEKYSPISHSVELGRQVVYRGDAPCFDTVKSSASTMQPWRLW